MNWARCDFCGHHFEPGHWNSRTCVACRGAGAPDQALDKNYGRRIVEWLKKKKRNS